MKKQLSALFTAAILFSNYRYGIAQNSGTPATIAATSGLFVTNILSNAAPGIITLPSGHEYWPIMKGGVGLTVNKSIVSAAKYLLTGQPYYSYSVSLPATCTLSAGGRPPINAGLFTDLSAGTGILNDGGMHTLKVGATFYIPASLPQGIYSNATTSVTINYN